MVYQNRVVKIPKNIGLALKLASDIIPKLPDRGDTILQLAVKALAIVDSVQNIMFPASKGGALDGLIAAYNLVEMKNEQFVSLFFDTNLYEEFNIHRFSLDETIEVIDASHPTYGRLFFIEYAYSEEGPEPFFYHEKGVDFSEILKGLWDAHEGRLHVTIGLGKYGMGTKSEFGSFPAWANPLYGSMQARMDMLVARHRRYVTDKVPRVYMFYGPPGTGKSSFSIHFAEKLGDRILKMDAKSFEHAHVRDVEFLLDNLKPDFLIVDDVDKADVNKGLPTLLEILQRFKDQTTTSVLMTANTVNQFDKGFLRPNRIDTWVEFQLPDEAERLDILARYTEQFKTHASTEHLRALAAATVELSQDYIREVALQLRYDEYEDVVRNIALSRKLLKEANAAKGPGPEVAEPNKKAE